MAVLDREVIDAAEPGFYWVRFPWGWEPALLDPARRWVRCGFRSISFGEAILEIGPRLVRPDGVPA